MATLILLPLTAYAQTEQAQNPEKPIGRYQIVIVPQGLPAAGPLLLDTLTGKTWFVDPTSPAIAWFAFSGEAEAREQQKRAVAERQRQRGRR
jgi:hypothetical protein